MLLEPHQTSIREFPHHISNLMIFITTRKKVRSGKQVRTNSEDKRKHFDAYSKGVSDYTRQQNANTFRQNVKYQRLG